MIHCNVTTEFYTTRCTSAVVASEITIPCIVSLGGGLGPHTDRWAGEGVPEVGMPGGSPIPLGGAGGCPEG